MHNLRHFRITTLPAGEYAEIKPNASHRHFLAGGKPRPYSVDLLSPFRRLFGTVEKPTDFGRDAVKVPQVTFVLIDVVFVFENGGGGKGTSAGGGGEERRFQQRPTKGAVG